MDVNNRVRENRGRYKALCLFLLIENELILAKKTPALMFPQFGIKSVLSQ